MAEHTHHTITLVVRVSKYGFWGNTIIQVKTTPSFFFFFNSLRCKSVIETHTLDVHMQGGRDVRSNT